MIESTRLASEGHEFVETRRPRSAQWHVAALSICFLLTAAVSWAGVTGSISGVVRDPSGALIPDVKVRAANVATGVQQVVRTNADGFYEFLSLPVGTYNVQAEKGGFETYRETGLVLNVNTALRVDITLKLGQVSQQITVTGSAVHVQTTNTQLGQVIGTTQIRAIPLNGRSYIDLLALQPGIVPQSVGGYSIMPVSGSLSSGLLSISGQRQTNNGYMVNGVVVNEDASMGTAIIPNLDSITEFRIITGSANAEYGNFSGGQVNVVTLSGTNQYHGDVFEFWRNSALDSRNFYDATRGKYIQNQFGGTFGGPIRRNKLFFFVDYQGTRQIIGQSTGDIPVPSLADRAGDLSDVASELTGAVNGPFWAQSLSQELGYHVTPGERYYVLGCTSTPQCVFPNAVIPQSAFSAPAKHLMQYIPLPNSGPFFSTDAFPQTLRDDKWGSRIDANTKWGMLTGYYHFDDFYELSPYLADNLPGFAAANLGRAQMFVLSDTKALGGTAVNEFHLGYVRDALYPSKPVQGVGPTLSSQGFVEGPGTLGIVPNRPEFEGIESISFNSYNIGVPGFVTAHYENTYEAFDNFAKIVGRHSLKSGGEFHWNQDNLRIWDANDNGAFGFTGSETGYDFADFLIGAPSDYQQSIGGFLDNRGPYVGLYGQDSWRVKANLVLNYGLRWEDSPFWHDTQNRLVGMVPGEQSVVFPTAPRGIVFPGDPGIPDTIAPTHYDNFAPRLGLAYSPSAQGGFPGWFFGGPGKSSFRASFGVFYSATQDMAPFCIAADTPYGDYYFSPAPPLFATPFIDRATGHSEGQRFPVGFPNAPTPSHPNTTFDWPLYEPIFSSPGIEITDRLPYAEEYTFSFERQLGSSTLLNLSYVGTQAHRLLASVEANAGLPALCLSVSQLSEVAPGSTTCGPFGENNVYTTAAGYVINGTRAPFGNAFGSDGYLSTLANSNYNALEISVHHTLRNMVFLLSYTYSKSLDNASDLTNELVNHLNPKISKGLSDFDTTHDFVFSYTYELPFYKLLPSHARISHGWRLTGVTNFATGIPVLIHEEDDLSLTGTFGTGCCSGSEDVPNFIPGNLDFTNPRSGKPYFNTSLFSPEQLGHLGNADRRFFHGPGINNWDIALLKDLGLTESKTIEFRAEFFNAFNHAQFPNPQGNIDSSTFGFVTSARDPRIGQLAIKFLF
jgi:hypothetical protein